MNSFYKLVFLLVFITHPIVAFGESGMVLIQYDQNGQEQWVHYPGDSTFSSNSLVVTADGSVCVAGDNSLLIACYSSDGTLNWKREIGSEKPNLMDLATDQMGNVFLLNYQKQFIDHYAYKLTKMSATGLEEWKIFWDDYPITQTIEYGNILIDSSGAPYLVINYTDDFDHDVIGMMKYEINGQLEWYQSYDQSKKGIDRASNATLDSENSLIVTGITYDPDDLCEEDVSLQKYNDDGSVAWLKIVDEYDEIKISTCDNPSGLWTDSQDNIILGIQSDLKGFIYKFNKEGTFLWLYSIDASEDEQNYYSKQITAIGADQNDNIFYISEKSLIEDAIHTDIGKLNPEGELLWENTYDDSAVQFPVSMKIDEEGNSVFLQVICPKYSIDNTVQCDYSIMKLNQNGEMLWNSRWSGKTTLSEYHQKYSFLELDPNGAIYILGNSWDPSDSDDDVGDDDTDQGADDDDDDSSGCGC